MVSITLDFGTRATDVKNGTMLANRGEGGGFKKQLGCSPNVCYVLLALDCIYSSREERESLAIVH